MSEINATDQDLINNLQNCLSARSKIEMHKLMAGLSRKDLLQCVEALKRPRSSDILPYTDATGKRITIGKTVICTSEGDEWGEQGEVVGLGNQRGDDVISVRFDDENFVREMRPAQLTMRV